MKPGTDPKAVGELKDKILSVVGVASKRQGLRLHTIWGSAGPACRARFNYKDFIQAIFELGLEELVRNVYRTDCLGKDVFLSP